MLFGHAQDITETLIISAASLFLAGTAHVAAGERLPTHAASVALRAIVSDCDTLEAFGEPFLGAARPGHCAPLPILWPVPLGALDG